MRVDTIVYSDGIYHVVLLPNWLEKLFGVTPKTKRLKPTNSYYQYGGQSLYIYDNGEKTEPGDYIAEAIDKWKRKF